MRSQLDKSISTILVSLILAGFGITSAVTQSRIIFVEGFDFDKHDCIYVPQRRQIIASVSSSPRSCHRNNEKYFSKLHSIVPNDEHGYEAVNHNPKEKVFNFRGGSGEVAATSRPNRRRHVVPMLVALTIGSFSVLEIMESIREEK